jgi:serine O-acetyltransferase
MLCVPWAPLRSGVRVLQRVRVRHQGTTPEEVPSRRLVPPSRHPIEGIVDRLHYTIIEDSRQRPHADIFSLPSSKRVIEIVTILRKIIFPGIFEEYHVTNDNIRYHLGMLLSEAEDLLQDQVTRALLYECQDSSPVAAERCAAVARSTVEQFMQTLPQLRGLLLLDVDACMRGDPAASSPEEIILCYPGVEAIFSHRIAHELFELKVPLIPRMISEYCHLRTAIDIHPGATIGKSFFIDHGTGVVIGETSQIGNNVKLFHGVTLGALSTKDGQALAGKKRHPTIEDDVTIYAGAVILGGRTVVGKGVTIGGSVFVTKSVPAGHVVSQSTPELHLKPPPGDTLQQVDYQSFDPGI